MKNFLLLIVTILGILASPVFAGLSSEQISSVVSDPLNLVALLGEEPATQDIIDALIKALDVAIKSNGAVEDQKAAIVPIVATAIALAGKNAPAVALAAVNAVPNHLKMTVAGAALIAAGDDYAPSVRKALPSLYKNADGTLSAHLQRVATQYAIAVLTGAPSVNKVPVGVGFGPHGNIGAPSSEAPPPEAPPYKRQ